MTAMTMTPIDWVLLAVVAVSALLGLMRGLIGALASLAAWVLAGWAAFQFGARVAVVIAGGDTPGPTQLFGGYALSFLAVLIVVGLVGWCVRILIKSIGLSGIDRFLGFVLGLVRGGFIACVLVLLLGFTALPQQPDWQRSRTLPVFLPGAHWLRAWLPDWAEAQIDFEPDVAAPLPAPALADKIALPLPRPDTQNETAMPADGTTDNGGVTPSSSTPSSSTPSSSSSHGAAAPSPTDA